MSVRYAEGTSVSAGRSKEEISKMLRKYGATKFAYMDDEDNNHSIVGFELKGFAYRFILQLPDRKSYRLTSTGILRSSTAAQKAYDQAVKEKWRALVATIKGKLIAIDNGIESFEEVFFKYTVVPGTGGRTAAEVYGPKIEEAYRNGTIGGLLSSGT